MSNNAWIGRVLLVGILAEYMITEKTAARRNKFVVIGVLVGFHIENESRYSEEVICAEYDDSRKILMSALIKKTTHAHATNKLNTSKDKSYNFRSNIF